MARYGLATILENHPVGCEFTADNLPLHLSLIDSFEIAVNADEVAAKLTKLWAHQQAFTVKALADELYGPNKDIVGTTLERTPELAVLHHAAVNLLLKEGAVLRNPQFNGDNFSPHISVYGSKRVQIGDLVPICDVSLAAKVSDADDASRRVLANITFAATT